jgi:hypothetical protein
MHPFTGLATREDGSVKVCCRSHPSGNIQDNNLEEKMTDLMEWRIEVENELHTVTEQRDRLAINAATIW